LTFGFKCRRDEKLKEIGLTPEDLIEIKEQFSKENNWDSELVCFGSLSYCCMRRGGCPKRDFALFERYPNMTLDKIMTIYFQKKKELSKRILDNIQDPEGKKKVKPFLDCF
jgi:predicted metal-binding transcription factor (methanogenesis marker protein 9)